MQQIPFCKQQKSDQQIIQLVDRMKRISTSTIGSFADKSSISPTPRLNLQNKQFIAIQSNETFQRSERKTDNVIECNFILDNLFEECYPTVRYQEKIQAKTFHKLQYKSLQNKRTKQLIIDRKHNHGLENFIHQTYNPKNEHQLTTTTDKSSLWSPIQFFQTSSKQTPRQLVNLTAHSFLYFQNKQILSTRHSCTELNMKTEDFQIKVDDYNFQTKNRLSTIDSYRLKENLEQTMRSGDSMELELLSKLCESVKIQARQMEQKQKILVEVKDKQFLRPYYRNQEQNTSSRQSIQQNSKIKNRFKPLAECACTIVSRYNASSQRKSVMQQSSIVFQASKSVSENYFQVQKVNQNLIQVDKTCSDGNIQAMKQDNLKLISVVSLNQNNNNNKDKQDQVVRNKIDNLGSKGFLRNKLKVGDKFLRSCRDQNRKQLSSEYLAVQEIRFDLDTSIEYGPV